MPRRLAFVAVGLLLSCGGAVADDPGVDAGTPRAQAADLTPDRALLATVKGIVQRSPQLAYAYANGGAVFATPRGFASAGDLAVDQHEYDKLAARIPRFADEALEVDVARMARLRIALTPIGARHTAGTLVDGKVTYRDVWPSTDLVALGSALYTEHLFVLRDAEAPHEVSYDVTLGQGLHAKTEADGAIVLADAKEEGRIRILAPYAVDANGVRHAAQMTLVGKQLRIVLERTGDLAYPVVLDPALESYVWEKKVTTDSPSARKKTAMSYDSDRKVMVLYGGDVGTSNQTLIGDTWEYNGVNWVKKCGAPLTACALPAIDQHAMAYHADTKKTFLHGWIFGNGSYSYRGLWDGTNWSVVSWALSAAGYPLARYNQAIAYDPIRKNVVQMGGNTFGGHDDTILWNGTTYTEFPTSVSCPGSVPRCRYDHSMTYHAASDRIVLFGGDGPKDDTWSYAPATKTWSLLAPLGKPAARSGHRIAYDAARQKTILFGGSGYLDDTWEWNGTTWTPVTPLTKPAGRRDFAFAADSARGRIVLFGGIKSDGAGSGVSDNETWEYHARGAGCTAGTQCDTGSCVDGVCCESPTCGTCQRCDGSTPGVCTAVISGDDDSCKTPAATCDGAGVCKKLQGQQCAGGGDCLSTYCVDGVCCGTPCTETCYACAADKKTTNADSGTCGPAIDGTDPHNSCDPSGECGTTGMCDGGGTCKKQPAGKSCGTGATCDGTVSKGSQCNGTGSCNVNPTGTECAPGLCVPGAGCKVTCTTNAECATSAFCDTTVGQCKPKQTNGQTCNAASQCGSNFCVDNVCCNSECKETCQSCAAVTKESGVDDGVCGAAKNGTNPHADCTKGSGGGACGQTGACDGAGVCKIEAAGVSCGSGVVCEGNVAKGQQCNGLGACENNATGSDCKESKCTAPAGCVSACAADSDCSASGWCDKSVTPAICKPKKKNGDTCTVASECENPFCVDTVCCNKPCAGQCEACNTDGAVGTCVPVNGAPKNGRAACDAGSGPSDCKARSCDGITPATCEGYAGPTVVCRVAACTDNKQVGEARCDAKGACLSDPPKACDPYVCSGTACKAACTANTDCVAPSTCDTASGKCVNAAKCDGDHTLTAPDGVTKTDCVPYRCDVSGTCKIACSSTDDCATPALCDAGKCVPPTANPGETEDSGGCAMGAPRSTSPYAIAVTVLAALGLARRKRCAAA